VACSAAPATVSAAKRASAPHLSMVGGRGSQTARSPQRKQGKNRSRRKLHEHTPLLWTLEPRSAADWESWEDARRDARYARHMISASSTTVLSHQAIGKRR
jgi:hypothetical protein